MVLIAKQAEEENNLTLAGKMYKELAQYVAPKRKSIEMTTTLVDKLARELTDDELSAIVARGDISDVC